MIYMKEKRIDSHATIDGETRLEGGFQGPSISHALITRASVIRNHVDTPSHAKR